MREIKFRAWTRQTPSMAWSQRAVAITGTGEQMVPIGGTYTGVWHVNDDGLIIEQYTGLKDKNGREIYEGDIVEEEIDCGDDDIDGTYRYTVVWDEDTLCWSLSPQYGAIHEDLWETNSSIKIVGNIHESNMEEEE